MAGSGAAGSPVARRGALIVLEGAEGVGKTTQARLLAAALESAGRSALVLREPGGTPVGERVRELLLDRSLELPGAAEALLFLASRSALVSDAVEPALERGEVVVLDRFFLSTYAYQIAGRGLSEPEVRDANRLATGGLVPEVTVVLELPGGEGLARAARRAARDRMEEASAAFHERVRAAFRTFADAAWQRSHPECGRIVVVDALGSEESVAERVRAAVWPVLGAGSRVQSGVAEAVR